MFILLLTVALSSRAPAVQLTALDSALDACVAAAKSDNTSARQAAAAAEQHYRASLAAAPTDLHVKVLLARVISECSIPSAPLIRKEGLAKESNRLLSEALAADSTNWEARYTLALNYYHAPSFFGWTNDAIREFEHLIAQQGDNTLFPELAQPFLYLGNLYDKQGRHADAVALWRRGSRLFPDNVRLRQRASVP